MTRARLISLFAILSIIGCALSAPGQRTTRKRLKPSLEAVAGHDRSKLFDTIATAADSAAIAFSGYEKTLSSSKESFFATNHTDSLITRLNIEITYLDMKGRQLDTRKVTLDTDFPPGETRRFDISAWDRQKVFYYHLSPTPRSSHATPYNVTIRLLSALRQRHN
ncbi:MAG: FxLYD domain-containing protein [Muribaculaceae bacterium]|nr:FxLYD domain-containing protein [Muribaculaceae bacterium]